MAMASISEEVVGRPEETPQGVVDFLADELSDRIARGVGGTITWFNHFSALAAMKAGVPVHRFDYLGLDGVFLCRLLGVDSATCRTSADLVLPRMLERSQPLRIALVGSRPQTLEVVAGKIERQFGHRVVLTMDGYRGRPEAASLQQELRAVRAQLVIVGLGTPLQDFYALSLKRRGLLVATCGGWLDQFAQDSYYPSWAYPLKLNWLVRLAKEPRRLWRRYSADAVRALRARAALTQYVAGQGARPLGAATAKPAPVGYVSAGEAVQRRGGGPGSRRERVPVTFPRPDERPLHSA
jgi:exopolysaccharide biosynthesis WecB/TagA/CpsF family protein